jgi:hypothetical protein
LLPHTLARRQPASIIGSAAPGVACTKSQSDPAEAVHVLNRMAFGPRRGDVQRVMKMGVDRYIDEQFHPDTIPMPAELADRLAKLRQGEMSQADLIMTYRKVIKAAMEDGTGGAPGDAERTVQEDGGSVRRAATPPGDRKPSAA